jgi:endonuclease/exonuclease/phosphatase family metal-dependent hydrolase
MPPTRYAMAMERTMLVKLTASFGVMAALLLPVTCPAADQGEAAGSVIKVLSYNIHGLFPLAAKDDPRDRMPTIGWLAGNYDVVMFQEDFEYHGVIRQQMEGRVGVRGNGVGWDPRRLGAKILIFPVAIFLPHFSPPYGAGVSIFAREELSIRDDFDRVPFGFCYGWFGANGDCWALKGFLRVGIRTPEGGEIDFYTTHLEAGPTQESVDVRRKQLDMMADFIDTRPRDRAVIVAGDFNSAFNRVGDRENVVGFRNRLDLKDSGAGPEIAFWRERNFILYRDGTKTKLTVEKAGKATEFVRNNHALSDHAALYAHFGVEATSAGEEIQ